MRTRMLRSLILPLLSGLLALVAGCSDSEPDSVALHDDGNELESTLEEMLPALQDAYLTPGAAVGVLRDGEVILARGFGWADREERRPVDGDTAFNIGSISKTVAAWGVMRLASEGRLGLDAPVAGYLSRWQLPKSQYDHEQVTLRRLLSHTAGLSLHGYPGFSPDQQLPSVEESLSGATNGAGAVYVSHEPGSKWQYSGGGYTVAQLIVEEVTGSGFAEYMDQAVLEPLGMSSSSYLWDDQIERLAATPYGDDGRPIPGPRFTAMAAAGLQTTLADFLRFAQASLGRENPVLDGEWIATLQEPVPPADHYGLGYDVEERGGRKLVGHGGSNDGWMARLTVVPETGDGLVVMTNGSNGAVLLRAIECEWWASVSGEPCTRLPELPVEVSADVLDRVVGRYQLPEGPLLDVRIVDGRLFVYLPTGFRTLALPRSETAFFLGAASASFEVELDDDGRVVALLFQRGEQPPERSPRVD